ncbi:MAG: transposase [Anaerolineales bacterium]|nr:transposase [Anaerolineales bacterium]
MPAGLEAHRHLGPRLEAAITYLHHEHHLSFQRLQRLLTDLFGTPLSEGGEVSVLERAGAAAQPLAEAIGVQVRQSQVIQSDETSCRVQGRNWWEWVFVSDAGEYHLIRQSRGQDVIDEFIGDATPEVWVSDCWKPQLNAPAQQRQLCLAHQIRAWQGLTPAPTGRCGVERRPRLRWALELQILFRAAVHLGKRRATLTKRASTGKSPPWSGAWIACWRGR